MFKKQRLNYSAYQVNENNKLNHRSQMVLNKFDSQVKKGNVLELLQKHNVEMHQTKNEERFAKADEGK